MLLSFLFLFFSPYAVALSFESQTSLGTYTFIEELSGSGKFGPAAKDKSTTDSFGWSVDYTQTKLTSTDPTSGDQIVDTTKDINVGGTFETPKRLTVDLNLEYANTAEESLAYFGPSAAVGYTYQFDAKKPKHKGKKAVLDEEDDDDTFKPDVGVKLTAATLNYVQTFSRTRKGRKKTVTLPTTGSSEIRQNFEALQFTGNPTSWLGLRLSETVFQYNKDVNTFLSTLDSNRNLGVNLSGMASTVTGLPESETLLEISFYLPSDFTVLVSEEVSKSAVDQSSAHTFKLMVDYDVTDHFTAGLGYQNDQSEFISDRLALIDLRYVF